MLRAVLPIHPPVTRSRRDFSAASIRSRAQDESYGALDKIGFLCRGCAVCQTFAVEPRGRKVVAEIALGD
jgi:hypothetical protein